MVTHCLSHGIDTFSDTGGCIPSAPHLYSPPKFIDSTHEQALYALSLMDSRDATVLHYQQMAKPPMCKQSMRITLPLMLRFRSSDTGAGGGALLGNNQANPATMQALSLSFSYSSIDQVRKTDMHTISMRAPSRLQTVGYSHSPMLEYLTDSR